MTELEELRLAYAECSRQRNELLTAHKHSAERIRVLREALVPLTDERIVELFRETFLAHTDPLGKDNMTIAFARAIERAHSIAAAGDKP